VNGNRKARSLVEIAGFFVFRLGGIGAGVGICRSELAREPAGDICALVPLRSLSLTLGYAPRPEGRGDRSECVGIPELAGSAEGFQLKPFLLAARTSPLSLQGEGWGEGLLRTRPVSLHSRASSLLRRAESSLSVSWYD